jgi:hypothetical protein
MSLDLEHNAWPSDSAATVISIDAEVIISRTGSYAAILMVLVANRVVPALIVFTTDCDHRLGGTTTSSTGC